MTNHQKEIFDEVEDVNGPAIKLKRIIPLHEAEFYSGLRLRLDIDDTILLEIYDELECDRQQVKL
ncbi:MAG: hypothetical protein AAFW47_07205, partial [Pseudomonadota bacterium]